MTSSAPGETPGQDPKLRIDQTSEPPAGWNRFVHRSEGASFCHLGAWGGVFRRSMRLEPIYLTARIDEKIHGVLPLVRMPRLGLGTALVSVPYLNYGGPLGSPEAQTSLLSRAVEAARGSRAKRLEIRSRGAPPPALPQVLSPAREKVTVVLDLPPDPETLFRDRFRSKLRAQIRRPMKEGMEVRFGAGEAETFYEVFSENMRDLGTPVLPRKFFQELVQSLPEQVEFGVVYHQGRPVAGGCGFRYQGEFEMTWASSLRAVNHLAPNMLLYWSFMERCVEKGDTAFNFGRCTPGGGTHRFKSQWGGSDEALQWSQWPEGGASESPDSGVFALATRVWQRLPLGVANRVGPFLSRRIPTF